MSNILTIAGDALTINFSVSNKLAVERNSIFLGDQGTVPDIGVFTAEVGIIFVGDLLNLSVDRLQALESDKAALSSDRQIRYGLTSVSGTFFNVDAPDDVETIYLAGINPQTNADDVAAFMTAGLVLADGTPPTGTFVGAFKRVT